MPLSEVLAGIDPVEVQGRVAQAVGIMIEGYGPFTSVGELCEVTKEDGQESVQAEVVGFRGDRALLMPLGDMRGIGPGSRILVKGQSASVPVGPALLGRVIDSLGCPLDGRGPLSAEAAYPLYAAPPSPVHRRRIARPMDVGVRAINGLLTCGLGQKLGIFASPGVGKSVLLGMISRYTSAEVRVIALIGERGREVNEFLERDLTPEAMRCSIVVVATSDQPPLVRIRGALVATAIAEYFRDHGRHVLLLMDSLTRMAQGQREVGLAVGEPPTTKGYPPSVFSLLPKVLERAGTSEGAGTITGLYTVLTDSDEQADPIADAVRAILDGHIVLSRDLASRNHFPAIDILQSSSRCMRDVVPQAHYAAARSIVESLSVYRRSEDLINLGAYHTGSNPALDRAIALRDRIDAYLRQGIEEHVPWDSAVSSLLSLGQALS